MGSDKDEERRERRWTKGGKERSSSTRSDDRRGHGERDRDRDGAAASADVERERMLERARRYVRENEGGRRRRRSHGHDGRRKRDRGSGGSGSDHGGAGSESGSDGDDDHRRRRDRKKHRHHRPSREEERGQGRSDRYRGGGRGRRSDGDRRRSRSRSRDRDRDGKRKEKSRGSSHRLSDRDGGRKHHEKGRKEEKRGRREEDGHRDDSRKQSRHGRKQKKESKESSTAGAAPENLYPLGPIANVAPEPPLDPEADYFAYNAHLRLFLYRKDGTYFEDLTSDQSRSAFETFVEVYNEGKLEEAYYSKSGLPTPALDQCKRTRHRWAFKTSTTERQSLDLVKEGVRKQTEYDAVAGASRPAAVATAGSLVGGGTNHVVEKDGKERPRKSERDIAAERAANRRLRERVKVAEEEMSGGKKDGRERMIEKRKEKAALQHGAARDREASAAGVELDDKEVFGDGEGESFQRALERERRSKARREEKKASRIAELQQKEKDKQADMLKMLGLSGLQPGQKITIAPRED